MTHTADSIRELFRRAAELAIENSVPYFSPFRWFNAPDENIQEGLILSVLRVVLTHTNIKIPIAIAQDVVETLISLKGNPYRVEKVLSQFALFFIHAGYLTEGEFFYHQLPDNAISRWQVTQALYPLSNPKPLYGQTIDTVDAQEIVNFLLPQLDDDNLMLIHLRVLLLALEHLGMRDKADTLLTQMSQFVYQTPSFTLKLERMCLLVNGLVQNLNRQSEYKYWLKHLKNELLYLPGVSVWYSHFNFPDFQPNGIPLTTIFRRWVEIGDFDSCEYMVDVSRKGWAKAEWFYEIPALIKRMCELGQTSRAKSILFRAFKGLMHFRRFPRSERFTGDYDSSILIGIALEMGWIKQAERIHKQVRPTQWHKSTLLLVAALIRAGQWNKALSLLAINIELLIHAAAKLAPELDAIHDGLAFEILSDCINIAAGTHPEWGVVAAMLQKDGKV